MANSADNREVELKLAIGADSLKRLDRVPPWSVLHRAPAQDIDSVYYDTSACDLRNAGFTLRVRRTPKGIVQTLKTTGAASGLFTRGEWECPLDRDEPDIAALGEVPLPDGLRQLKNGSLMRICRTRVRRAKKDFAIPGSGHVEIALDVGAVEVGKDEVPIAEIELELKNGSPAALFELARQLNELMPVRLQTLSKPELGFAALDPDTPLWTKAAPLGLQVGDSIDDTLQTIFAGCLSHLLANIDSARHRRHIEGVHQVRVAVRRLRSALRLFADFLPAEPSERLDNELSWFAGALGPARDWDVFRTELLAWAKPGIDDKKAYKAIDGVVARLQDEGYQRVAAAIDSNRFGGLMLELSRWQSLRVWRDQPLDSDTARLFDPIVDAAGPLLDALHRRVLKRGRKFVRLSVDDRHRVRIAAKRLRYGLEFLADLYDGKNRRAYQKRLSRLQDDLGHLNDVAVAERLVADILNAAPDDSRVAGAAGAVLGWHRRGLREGEPALLSDWRQFEKAKPFWG